METTVVFRTGVSSDVVVFIHPSLYSLPFIAAAAVLLEGWRHFVAAAA